jgi:TRAP-type mannitol/chloroaromatic compound transport system permease small subunit
MINNINEYIGKICSWLALALVLMVCAIVVQRYVFNSGYNWQAELARFFHAILFLSVAGYTLKYDKHVRVDVLYNGFSERKKAWVNLLGSIFLLIPSCMAIIYFSYDYVLNSWRIFEGSSEYQGMPGFFLLKSFIWVFATTLGLQGVSLIVKSLQVIRGY